MLLRCFFVWSACGIRLRKEFASQYISMNATFVETFDLGSHVSSSAVAEPTDLEFHFGLLPFGGGAFWFMIDDFVDDIVSCVTPCGVDR